MCLGEGKIGQSYIGGMRTAFYHQFITSLATQGIPVARANIMRAFIVFSCLALAAAKPQYSYSQPSSLLGSSSNSHGHAIGGQALLPSSSNQNFGLAPPGNATTVAIPAQQKIIIFFFVLVSPWSVAAPLQSFHQSQPLAPITTTTVQKHIYVSWTFLRNTSKCSHSIPEIMFVYFLV